jgi:2-hydroxycyclohexanecarboxyl-CoA dehydrogenase
MSGTPVALITGAARGTGAAIAERLAADGFHIAIFDIEYELASKRSADISARFGVAYAYQVDVRDRPEVENAVGRVVADLGRIDVLVNNAAIISLREFDEINDEEWHRVMGTNLTGPFILTQVALPHLLAQRRSRVVNIASNLAKHAYPLYAHYVSAKAGLVGLTQALAVEFAGTGLTANSVCPAITDTPMMDQVVDEIHARDPASAKEDIRKSLTTDIPLGRPASPVDVAAAVSFLVSADADFITAQAINVSGGQLRL